MDRCLYSFPLLVGCIDGPYGLWLVAHNFDSRKLLADNLLNSQFDILFLALDFHSQPLTLDQLHSLSISSLV